MNKKLIKKVFKKETPQYMTRKELENFLTKKELEEYLKFCVWINLYDTFVVVHRPKMVEYMDKPFSWNISATTYAQHRIDSDREGQDHIWIIAWNSERVA